MRRGEFHEVSDACNGNLGVYLAMNPYFREVIRHLFNTVTSYARQNRESFNQKLQNVTNCNWEEFFEG